MFVLCLFQWDCQVNLNGYRWNASRKRGDEYRSRGLLRRSSRIARREKKHDVETTAEESDVRRNRKSRQFSL